MSAAAWLAATAAAASAPIAAVPGSEATMRWAPVAGPLTGYLVWASRNGDPMQFVELVDTNQVTISGQPGETIEIAVQAFAYPNGAGQPAVWGALSELSDPIRFDGPSVLRDAFPWVDCASCRRFEQRDAGGSALLAVAHPAQGVWDLVGVGELAPGASHALLRERATGSLVVDRLFGGGAWWVASVAKSSFATSTVFGPSDLDGDGIAEILLHDRATGAVEIWGLVEGSLEEVARWSVPKSWRPIGVGDVDGDRLPDAWFDATQGAVAAVRLSGFSAIGSPLTVATLPGFAPTGIADYDGDGWLDVLWRNAAGVLQVGLRRSGAPEVRTLAWQPGDESVVPRVSRDLDGAPGAEIVLQDLRTGAVDVALPADAIPGRRQRLPGGDPSWRVVAIE